MKKTKRMAEIEQQFNEPFEELVKGLYAEEEMTIQEIADLFQCTFTTVFRWFSELGIQRRRTGKRIKKQAYTFEEATTAYVTYSSQQVQRGEQPVSIDVFFAKYDPNTLGPALNNPPLATYLHRFRKPEKTEEKQVRKTAKMLAIEARLQKSLEELLDKYYVREQQTPEEIGAIFGVTDACVRNYLNTFGIETRNPREAQLARSGATKPDDEELRKLYTGQKVSTTDLCKKYGVAQPTIHNWLREAGIKVRGRSESRLVKTGAIRPDDDVLKKEYIDDGMSLPALAEKYHTNPTTISYWLDKIRVKRRTISEARLSTKGGVKPSEEELTDLYVNQHLSTVKIGKIYSVASSCVGNWLDEIGILRRTASEALLANSGGTKPNNDVLHDLYEKQKLSSGEIAEKYKVTSSAVGSWLQDAGIAIRDKKEAARLYEKMDTDKLYDLYVTQGLRIDQIADAEKVSDGVVKRWLQDANIPVRGRGMRKTTPQYSLEEATERYTTYVGQALSRGEVPVPLDTFFGTYDPVTLKPAEGKAPLQIYLNRFRTAVLHNYNTV